MNYLIKTFVIVLALALFGCSENQSSNAPDTHNNISTKEATITPKPITVAKRDTTPPPRRRYMVDTSRPKNKIKPNFPFDIPITNPLRDSLNTENILAKNGKPTIVLFWLTTCYPCRIEMNAIKKVYPEWKKEADFNLVAISTDFQKNYERFIKRVEKEAWEWDTYHDTSREFRKVLPGGLNGLPQTFVFDKDGNIAYHKRKYQTGDELKLFEEVKKLAAK